MICDYYKKDINDLTSYEIIKLLVNDRRYITYEHLVRFNIVMISDDPSVRIEDYTDTVLPLLDDYLED